MPQRAQGNVVRTRVVVALIGADWMSETGCFLSIPPAYTKWIGAQLIHHLRSAAA